MLCELLGFLLFSGRVSSTTVESMTLRSACHIFRNLPSCIVVRVLLAFLLVPWIQSLQLQPRRPPTPQKAQPNTTKAPKNDPEAGRRAEDHRDPSHGEPLGGLRRGVAPGLLLPQRPPGAFEGRPEMTLKKG